ncbi:MFS transporter [Microbacterium sp. No. 7]|uniref:MFS transporter n=1 Tax=Microbacterium sp. No. 7 TaxID=1714373 RepID=UPI0006D00B2C|nr:MFS transporter [Microbacterium sp. No. 7]ALJ20011.1 MFS transporter [Microbacterium sp. No. 7]
MTLQTNVDAVPDEPIRRVLWRLAPMIYGPTVLFSIGEGAVLPVLPVLAARLGADVPTAAVVASALVVGQLCGNLPAGAAVSRVGERATMAGAGVVAMAGAVGAALATTVWMLTLAMFVTGLCAAAFGLARHSFMATRVPLGFRARALSLLGGSFRLGMFAGPFVAAGLLALTGDERSTLWLFLGCLVAVVVLVLLGPDPETRVAALPSSASGDTGAVSLPERAGVLVTMWRYRGVLARLGLAAAALAAVRSARQIVLPVWGVSIGLDASSIALAVGISGAVDFALFYASGQVMDRFGRLWAALPATVLMGAGFLALSFTHDLSDAAMWFTMLAAVLGIGNGLSSGILLTLGADIAPRDDPASFLGSWRTLTDAGGALAPVLVAAIAAAGSLPLAVAVVGVLGLLGAAGFARWVPRFVPRIRP